MRALVTRRHAVGVVSLSRDGRERRRCWPSASRPANCRRRRSGCRKEPRVTTVDEATAATPGKQGGTIRMLMAEQNDLRMVTVYGYARLVAL